VRGGSWNVRPISIFSPEGTKEKSARDIQEDVPSIKGVKRRSNNVSGEKQMMGEKGGLKVVGKKKSTPTKGIIKIYRENKLCGKKMVGRGKTFIVSISCIRGEKTPPTIGLINLIEKVQR